MTATSETGTRRRYDSAIRRAQAAQTRERILDAGTELLRGASVGDWRGLTIRAVAERAGVNERTVYRHFANERALRDALMQHLEQEVGIDLVHLRLDGVADAAARIFEHVESYQLERRRASLDPTLIDANRRQHEALLAAVDEHADGWSDADRTLAAAMLDVLWSVASYERLAVDWELDREEATRGIAWVIGLVEEAVRDGRRPEPVQPMRH